MLKGPLGCRLWHRQDSGSGPWGQSPPLSSQLAHNYHLEKWVCLWPKNSPSTHVPESRLMQIWPDSSCHCHPEVEQTRAKRFTQQCLRMEWILTLRCTNHYHSDPEPKPISEITGWNRITDFHPHNEIHVSRVYKHIACVSLLMSFSEMLTLFNCIRETRSAVHRSVIASDWFMARICCSSSTCICIHCMMYLTKLSRCRLFCSHQVSRKWAKTELFFQKLVIFFLQC